MSAKANKYAPGFAFTKENEAKIAKVLKKYPKGREASAVKFCLDLAQRQEDGWLHQEMLEVVADRLGMPSIKVYEVATFYNMFHLKPIGKHHLKVCTTTPCWLRGSGDILAMCQSKTGLKPGEVSSDGQFSLEEVECLGGCVNAPVVQISDDYFEDLDASDMEDIIDDLAEGRQPKRGSRKGRHSSEPASDKQTKREVS